MSDQILVNKSFSINGEELTEAGEFIAIASTEIVDLQNEIVVIKGIQKNKSILPLFFNHQTDCQIGEITELIEDKENNKPILKVKGYIDLQNKIPSYMSIEKRQELRQKSKDGEMELSIGFAYDKQDAEKKIVNGKEVNQINKSIIQEVSFTPNGVNQGTKIEVMKSVELSKELIEERKSLIDTVNNTLSKAEFDNIIYKLHQKGFLNSKNKLTAILDYHNNFVKRCNEVIEKNKSIEENNKPNSKVLTTEEQLNNFFLNKK